MEFNNILSFFMFVYLTSCVYYLIFTKNIGTPFRDSLTKQQLKLKKKASDQRKNIFIDGVIVSILLNYILNLYI